MASNGGALIFIDANQYLNLYRITKGKTLLTPLLEQREHIFVTEQVVEEVQRNKLQVAATFLTAQFENLKIRSFEVPDHLLGVDEATLFAVRQKLKLIRTNIDEVNRILEDATLQTLELISRSEDEVSKALDQLFGKAIKPTPEELQRARERKEKGNPPGKPKDLLGDQLTWEQLLTVCKGKAKLWIQRWASTQTRSLYVEFFGTRVPA